MMHYKGPEKVMSSAGNTCHCAYYTRKWCTVAQQPDSGTECYRPRLPTLRL